MGDGFLQRVYGLETQDDTNAYYSAWAETYDAELVENGYVSPRRCAEALSSFVASDAPVLDFGCGTGLSGEALAAAGFTNVSGADLNAEMLAVAEAKGVYQAVLNPTVDDPFPFSAGAYAAMAAVGVIGVGAAPPTVLGQALNALAPGGHLVFSFNDHAQETPEFVDALSDALGSGLATEVFNEDGPHIEKLESRARIYVLRRT